MVKSEKGQAVVEFALSFTLLVFLVFGMLDIGRMLYTKSIIVHASREAVRSAAVGGVSSEVTAAAQRSAYGLETAKMDITVTPADGSRQRGSYATVRVDYPFEFITPIIGNLFGEPFVLNSESTMRVE